MVEGLSRSEKKKNLKQMRSLFGGGAIAFGLVAWLGFAAFWWWIPATVGAIIWIATSCGIYEAE